MNIVFFSPTFPKSYYQFPRATKKAGITTLGIAEEPYDLLDQNLKSSLDDYYQVSSLHNYDEVYRAVAYFSFKYGKIDYLESNNEFWLEQDARLRTDFNITSSYNLKDIQSFKFKSGMKAYYEKAGIKVARYHLVSSFEEGKKFIEKVGYPVVVKPDNGVGANATYKISNDEELEIFYDHELPTQYIMEEFVPGQIVSYDGIAGPNSEVIFETSHIFTENVMEIVNNVDECFYYTNRNIPDDVVKAGRAVIKSFCPRNRFFHCEFFRMNEDKEGLGKKGDLIGLEVNMRPPGGFTTDLINYGNDIDVYQTYANMLKHGPIGVFSNRPYYCGHLGRRDGIKYAHNKEDIEKKFGKHIVLHDRMPDILATAMGNEFFFARFEEEKDLLKCAKYIYKKQEK